MGNPFKTPKSPDTSKQDAALDRQEAMAKDKEEEQKRKLAARRRAGTRGARSLIKTSETGEALQPGLRENLG